MAGRRNPEDSPMRTRSSSPFLFFAAVTIAAVISACAGSTAPNATTRVVASPSPTTAVPRAQTGPNPASGIPNAGLLVGRTGESNLRLVVAQTGMTAMDIPAGTPDSGWTGLVMASADGGKTKVRDVTLEGGLPGPEIQLDGHWRLPTIGTDPVSVGVSADRSTIALVAAGAASAATGTSRFAVVQHFEAGRPTTARYAKLRLATMVELRGSFEFDALSPDGSILYVVEHLDGQAGAYQVRAVDVATGKLRDGVIADKRNLGEAMAGWPIGQVRRADGVVLTLYRGSEHPFVHALNTVEAWAVCLDLPPSATSDAAAARDWGLAPNADGRRIYAINGSLGIAAEINATDLSITRTATVQTVAAGSTDSAGSIVLAKFGGEAIGPAGRAVVSPDGKTIWAAGVKGVLAVDTGTLSAGRRMLDGTAVDGIAATPDGSGLFALLHAGGQLVALDPATGRTLGSVPGGGFDRLLATAPW
jgi:DNA-binding beta-propeller fold protein YncE